MGIKVKDLAFVRIQVPDLDVMERFLLDFGMVRAARTEDTLYMRGTNDAPYLHVSHLGSRSAPVGWAFLAADVSSLDELAGTDGFSAVEALDAPGGGSVVRTTDPDGFQVEVVEGWESAGTLPSFPFVTRNDGQEYRRKGASVRLEPGPSHVRRLGHCVLSVTDYQTSRAWYHEHFGLVISDEIHNDEGVAKAAFMRCDQGRGYVDHHTLALFERGQEPGLGHCAFEVPSFEDLMLGNATLTGGGYRHSAGIGRHLLGSQIFDYWLDPWGNAHEHWTDGDLFNDETPPRITGSDELRADQWGPANTFSERRLPS